MYLEHFKFGELPFSLAPNTQYFCNLPGHQEALNVILLSLRNAEGFIKIVGEVGSGKTLLCRKVLNSISDAYDTAYIPSPDFSPNAFRRAFAVELGIEIDARCDQQELLYVITEKLLASHKKGKPVVLIVDEAQSVSFETLEALRLLTNIETESHKLLQVLLFAQPELDVRLREPKLRQLRQRISFSYYLSPIDRGDLDAYLWHRLSTAGHDSAKGRMFSQKACDRLFSASGGIPRLINVLCHKALMTAYGKGESVVSDHSMLSAIQDTESVHGHERKWRQYLVGSAVVLVLAVLIRWYLG